MKSFHKAKVVKDWIEEDGNFELAFIPPYSPELNPVEVFNQVLKVKMRMAPAMTQAEAQTFAQEQAQSMKQGKGAGIRKCFERDSVKYSTYRESQKHLRKLFKSTLNNRLHRNLACVIDKSSRGAKLERAFEELP